MKAVGRVFLLVCVFAGSVSGHGRLNEPPGRSTMWRLGYSTPNNYDDNQLFCGGFWRQHNKNHGKCGICGDPWDAPEPRENEAGGKYGNGIITKTYKAGQVIDVTVQLTANHKGYFEFRLCPNNNPKKVATQECLDRYLLHLADGSGTKVNVPSTKNLYNIRLKLPEGLTCTQCVLQWHYRTGNSWGYCPDGSGRLGCGPQEVFRGCSDVAIKGDVVRTASTTRHATKPATRVTSTQSTKPTTATKSATTGSHTTRKTHVSSTMSSRMTSKVTGYTTVNDSSRPTIRVRTTIPPSPSSNHSRPRPSTTIPPQDDPTSTRNAATPTHGASTATRDASTPTRDASTPTRGASTPTRDASTPTRDASTPTRHASTDVPTPSSRTNPPRGKICVSAGAYRAYPGMTAWCEVNCHRGFCPNTHCECLSPKLHDFSNCRSGGKYKGYPGMDAWCLENCKRGLAFCPESRCFC